MPIKAISSTGIQYNELPDGFSVSGGETNKRTLTVTGTDVTFNGSSNVTHNLPSQNDTLVGFKTQYTIDTKVNGVYTTVDGDFGHLNIIRVDDDVTLLDPVVGDVGKVVQIRNISGTAITITSSATLNGNTTLNSNETMVALVVAASEYDLTGGV